jgi:hypothetical protein
MRTGIRTSGALRGPLAVLQGDAMNSRSDPLDRCACSKSARYMMAPDNQRAHGVFEIGTRLSTSGTSQLIMHRFFRPL